MASEEKERGVQMGGISIFGWIAIVVVVLLELATMMVFLYQRTVRKLALRMGVDQRVLVFLYPQYMLRMYQLSFLKWPLYIYLLFVNYVVAIGIFAASFLLSMMMPVVDWRHLLCMREMLKRSFCELPEESYEALLIVIDDSIAQTGYDITKVSDYKDIISKFRNLGEVPESVMAISMSLTFRAYSAGDSNPLKSIHQARIHIRSLKKLLGVKSDPRRDAEESYEQETPMTEQSDLFAGLG